MSRKIDIISKKESNKCNQLDKDQTQGIQRKVITPKRALIIIITIARHKGGVLQERIVQPLNMECQLDKYKMKI